MRGQNRALIAVAHGLLVTVYSFTVADQPYQDLGLDCFNRLHERQLEKTLVRRLESSAIALSLNPAVPPPELYFQGSGVGAFFSKRLK